MRICLVHGYLLTGTGSNIYVKNMARELSSQGHDVSVMCQERHPEELDFVDEAFVFDETNSRYEKTFGRTAKLGGRCRVFRPSLGALLVYVKDTYEGFERVETLQEAQIEDIEEFARQNVEALKRIIEEFEPEVIQANHLVMQPYVVRKAVGKRTIPYVITLHGSDINFSLRRDRRLHRYAMEGLAGASEIIGVSSFNAEDFNEYLLSKGEKQRDVSVIPAGVDTGRFKPTFDKGQTASKLIEALRSKIEIFGNGERPYERKAFLEKVIETSEVSDLKRLFEKKVRTYAHNHPDRDVVDLLRGIDWENDQIVLFVGKYLWTKGAQLIITAAPLILSSIPNARFMFVGFGKSKEILQALVAALSAGKGELFEKLLSTNMEIDPGSNVETEPVCLWFLDELKRSGELEAYFEKAAGLDLLSRISFTGIMNHNELRYLLPLASVFVAPSLFSEAFGSVAIEALSCGIFPVVSYQFGLKEIHDILEREFGRKISKLQRITPDAAMVKKLAHNIVSVITDPNFHTADFKEQCYRIAFQNFGWKTIARRYVELFEKLRKGIILPPG